MTRAIIWTAVSSGRQAENDKESLPEQDNRLTEIAREKGWDVIDLIVVPGYSRVYYNYREFAEAAEADGIPGPVRMFSHWEKKDFDIFACIDGSRFGREQSIFAEVVGRTIDGGAQVFSMKDGYIHQGNKRMYVSMGGYAAASEIDELVRRHKMGFRGRAEKGLKVSARTLFGYREIRDDKGKVIRQEPDPNLTYIFELVAESLLKGTPWNTIARELYEQHNIVNPHTGKIFHHGLFHDAMMSPTFWGHTAINFTRESHTWVIDETEPVPENVQVWRNTHEPIYTGELADAVRQELLRRSTMTGRATPHRTRRFSGFVVCGECGKYMSFTHDRGGSYQAMRCQTYFRPDVDGAPACHQKQSIHCHKIVTFLKPLLQEILDSDDPESILELKRDDGPEIARLKQSLRRSQEAMNSIAYAMRSVNPANPMFAVLTNQAEQIGDETRRYQQDLQILEARHCIRDKKRSSRTIQQVAEMKQEKFWLLPEREINQMLLSIFEPFKIIALNGEVLKMEEREGRRRTRKLRYNAL